MVYTWLTKDGKTELGAMLWLTCACRSDGPGRGQERICSPPQLILLCCIHSVPRESPPPRRGASLWTVTRGFAPAGCQSLSGCVELQLHQFLFYFGLEAGGKLTNVS